MPTFIAANLLLSYLVQTGSPYQSIFAKMPIFYFGTACILASAAGALLSKKASTFLFDLFASGILLMWFSYWHRIYRDDAPIFYFFPLYFAFFNALVTLIFVNRRHRFDIESINYIRRLSGSIFFKNGIIVTFVLISLATTTHYLLFPIAMTLFMLRFVLSRCLAP